MQFQFHEPYGKASRDSRLQKLEALGQSGIMAAIYGFCKASSLWGNPENSSKFCAVGTVVYSFWVSVSFLILFSSNLYGRSFPFQCHSSSVTRFYYCIPVEQWLVVSLMWFLTSSPSSPSVSTTIKECCVGFSSIIYTRSVTWRITYIKTNISYWFGRMVGFRELFAGLIVISSLLVVE